MVERIIESYERGKRDCCQDQCEGAPFGSVGGLGSREDPKAPKWIKPADAEAYLIGYRTRAREIYGDDWMTCRFGFAPALELKDG